VPAGVPADIALCLFRVLQEALRNAVRHSAARRFAVSLQGTADALSLTVRDDGRGFDAESAAHDRGLGLTSMRERLKLVAGELSIESKPGKGTTIMARVPLATARATSAPTAGVVPLDGSCWASWAASRSSSGSASGNVSMPVRRGRSGKASDSGDDHTE
jgi:hypothetical protein